MQRIAIVAFLQLGIEYDGYNLYLGFRRSKNKVHAALCMIPFFQCILSILAAQHLSQFWDEYRAFFVMYAGVVLTAQTANLNLMSMARVDFEPLYLDPLFYAAVMYADYTRAVEPKMLVAAYTTLLVVRTVCYLLFMRSVINQICAHLNIPFVTVIQQEE